MYFMFEDLVLLIRSVDGLFIVVILINRFSKVLDYVKNLLKYIYYILDWLEEDEEYVNLVVF